MTNGHHDDRRLGLLFMAGVAGRELDDSTRLLIDRFGIGNFIIFSRNVEGPEQLRALCRSLVDACVASGLPVPLIAIDQEGGTVARLPPPFTQFPDARQLAVAADAESLLRDYARVCARELLGVGVNLNLAPVLDVCPAEQGLFMERRSLGADPGRVAELGTLIIREMQQAGLGACAKHFPGLGGAVFDPHLTLPTVTHDLGTIETRDLPPFAAAIKAGVATVMTSHTIYPALDPGLPATLSATIIQGLLRSRLGYQGLVLTDDLEMGAIENEHSVAAAGLAAFQAGADLLLICHDHAKVTAAWQALAGAVAQEEVSEERLAASLDRLARVRRRFARSGRPG